MNETYLWTKPAVLGREYLLLRENSEQGKLTFNGSLSANATANGNTWAFTRIGFLRPTIVIRRDGENSNLAAARMRLGGGCDVTIGGRSYKWGATKFLSGEYGWEDENGEIAVRYLAAPRMTRTIQVAGTLPAEVKAVLLFLGGYLLALQSNDVATMTAAVSASTTVY